MKRVVVVSAVNLVEMGPLVVVKDALETLSRHYADTCDVIAIVHRKELFDIPNITFLDFPEVKGSWLRRLKFEYFDLKQLSRQVDADLWLSMHDVTPNVRARRQAVYCHNPSPFYPFRPRDLFLDGRVSLFSLLYRSVYRINIRRNAFVIVQQHWLRQAFEQMYGISNVVVAHPLETTLDDGNLPVRYTSGQRPCRFFYPCFPRLFKNIETLLRATTILAASHGRQFEVWLTLDGSENGYAAQLVKRYRHLPQVHFGGLLPRKTVQFRYAECDCLVFPSRLETWGLPLSEFKHFRKPILAANLPYAHETVGDYDHAAFFSPDDAEQLALLMKDVVCGTFRPSPATASTIPEPFCRSWRELFELLLAPET